MPVWVRGIAFVLLAPGTVAGWLPWVLANHPSIARAPVLVTVGAVLIAVGWSILLWCARDFAVRGRGTLAPMDPPRALVTRGFYEYVRNPMYVGVITAVLGQAACFASVTILEYAVVVFAVFHTMVVVYEEPKLIDLFGNAYADYQARVPRWIPRLRRT
jgi:protein-S-isoprenylcysteine O-methyltransferase Ste14